MSSLSLHDYVYEALTTDPDRVIPMIPYILSRISAPRIVLETRTNGITTRSPGIIPEINHVPPPSTLATHTSLYDGIVPDDPFVEHGGEHVVTGHQARPTFLCGPLRVAEEVPHQVGDTLSPVSSPSKASLFYFTPMGEQNELPEEDSLYCDAGHTNLQVGVEDIRNAIIFHVNDDVYRLSVPKPIILNTAYGFVWGALSFLWLRTLSYSPLGAFICAPLLSLALVLVFGNPVWPEELH
ncbi:hypothetical protein BDM02DRAFT_3130190 [Thelephora ganbajun]|uniref:Uncharacterized protein n=1 Tax=Thelephora ganbajun TaxID=370292 RepID=A0ACB6ZAU7_THEGA|nr:hypothetical protein BDM02DRAFT_3130190 [Thelephora ganbajun]